MSSKPGQVKPVVRSTSVQIVLEPKISVGSASVYLRAGAFAITSDVYDNVAVQFFSWITDGGVVRAGVSVP